MLKQTFIETLLTILIWPIFVFPAIGTVLYEKRLNAFSEQEDDELKNFILAVHQMFETTGKVTFMPEFIKKTVGRKWVEIHENAWDVIFTTGMRKSYCIQFMFAITITYNYNASTTN